MTLAEVLAIGMLKGLEGALVRLVETLDDPHAAQFRPLLIEAQHAAATIYAAGVTRRGAGRMDLSAYMLPLETATSLVLRACAVCPEQVTAGVCRLALGGAAASIEMHVPSSRRPADLEKAITTYWENLWSTARAIEARRPEDLVQLTTSVLDLAKRGVAIGWSFPRVVYVRRMST